MDGCVGQTDRKKRGRKAENLIHYVYVMKQIDSDMELQCSKNRFHHHDLCYSTKIGENALAVSRTCTCTCVLQNDCHLHRD
jgi:hypothetical protein